MNKDKFTRAGFEPATSRLRRHVNPEVAGLKMYSASFPCGLLQDGKH